MTEYKTSETRRAAAREYKKKHREKLNADSLLWYYKNKDRSQATSKRWKVDNQEKTRTTERTWKETHPEKIHVSRVLSKQRVKRAMPLWVDREELERKKAACPPGYDLDHIVPLDGLTPDGYMVSGLHVPWNLQPLLPAENKRKNRQMTRAELDFVEGR